MGVTIFSQDECVIGVNLNYLKALTADALPAALALEGGVIRVRNGGVHDHNFLRNNVQRAQRVLLRYYDWVLFAEADEFVVINATSANAND